MAVLSAANATAYNTRRPTYCRKWDGLSVMNTMVYSPKSSHLSFTLLKWDDMRPKPVPKGCVVLKNTRLKGVKTPCENYPALRPRRERRGYAKTTDISNLLITRTKCQQNLILNAVYIFPKDRQVTVCQIFKHLFARKTPTVRCCHLLHRLSRFL